MTGTRDTFEGSALDGPGTHAPVHLHEGTGMTTHREASEGFEDRLLHALTEIDAARPAAGAPSHPAPGRRTRRARRLTIVVATFSVVLGGTAMASASGLFGSAPRSVMRAFAGLDAHGRSIDAGKAVRVGVIDDHVAYAAPTSGGGFCLYFGKNPRSGPTGGTCIHRGAARDEAVFSVLPGTDGGLLFGRVGTARARKVTVAFPRSGETVGTPVADSGFFAVKIPDRSMRSLMSVIPPDRKHSEKSVKGKDGGPVLSFQLDRVTEISVTALDGQDRIVARGIAVPEPGGPGPTTGPSATPSPRT